MPDPDSFRQWLTLRLSLTKLRKPDTLTDEEFAAKIGVHPDVWQEAKRWIIVRKSNKVRHNPKTGPQRVLQENRHFSTTKRFQVDIPNEVCDAVDALCKLQKIQRSDFLRSAVEYCLRLPRLTKTSLYDPGAPWIFMGRECLVPRTRVQKYRIRWRLTAHISYGSYEALVMRAEAHKTSLAGLMRGVILDVLECRARQFPLVMSTRAQLSDAARYVEFWED